MAREHASRCCTRARLSRAVALAAALCLATACADESPTARRSGKHPALHLQVASYNIWAVPLASASRRDRVEKLPAALHPLAIDVLCLQEVWTPGDLERLRDRLKDRWPHAAQGGGGLLLLSRFPITRSRFVPFPVYAGLSLGERLARKGLLDVLLQTGRGPLRVVTSHLALARGPHGPRRRQLDFLLEHLDADRTLPVVLAGDLNTASVQSGVLGEAYRAILDHGFADASPPRRLPGGAFAPPPATRIGWPRPPGQPARGWSPDYVLFRSGAGARLVLEDFRLALDTQETALSDHNLLLAALRLDRAALPAAKEAR